MRKMSAKKLAPLKMPPLKVLSEPKPDNTDSPHSSGSNTPTSTSVNDILSTPPQGGGEGSMSPQYGNPPTYPYSQQLSPITDGFQPFESQALCSSTMAPLKIDIDEEKINEMKERVPQRHTFLHPCPHLSVYVFINSHVQTFSHPGIRTFRCSGIRKFRQSDVRTS